MPSYILYARVLTDSVSDFAVNAQAESFDINSKGTTTICSFYFEEVPHHEIPAECLHGSK